MTELKVHFASQTFLICHGSLATLVLTMNMQGVEKQKEMNLTYLTENIFSNCV